MSKPYFSVTKILLIIMIPIWIMIGIVQLLATSEFIESEYNKADFPEDIYGFSPEERLTFASENVRYLQENLPISTLKNQTNDGFPLYNARELSHMEDVQEVFQFFKSAWIIISVLFGIATLLTSVRPANWEQLASVLKIGGGLTASLIATLGLLAIVSWDTWFLIFHKLFFTSGTWTFSYSDTLIRLFPQKFWMDGVFTLTGFSLVGGLLVGLTGWRWQNHSNFSVQKHTDDQS